MAGRVGQRAAGAADERAPCAPLGGVRTVFTVSGGVLVASAPLLVLCVETPRSARGTAPEPTDQPSPVPPVPPVPLLPPAAPARRESSTMRFSAATWLSRARRPSAVRLTQVRGRLPT